MASCILDNCTPRFAKALHMFRLIVCPNSSFRPSSYYSKYDISRTRESPSHQVTVSQENADQWMHSTTSLTPALYSWNRVLKHKVDARSTQPPQQQRHDQVTSKHRQHRTSCNISTVYKWTTPHTVLQSPDLCWITLLAVSVAAVGSSHRCTSCVRVPTDHGHLVQL